MGSLKTRLDLDRELRELLGSDNVYFSPPESLKLKYPCIVYYRIGADTINADNDMYLFGFKYNVTIIDRDPDSGALDGYNTETMELDYHSDTMIEKMLKRFQHCTYNNHRFVNNLNHDTFTLYY